MKLIFKMAHFETYVSWNNLAVSTLYWHVKRFGNKIRIENFKKI